MKKITLSTVLLASAFFMVGCGGSSSTPPPDLTLNDFYTPYSDPVAVASANTDPFQLSVVYVETDNTVVVVNDTPTSNAQECLDTGVQALKEQTNLYGHYIIECTTTPNPEIAVKACVPGVRCEYTPGTVNYQGFIIGQEFFPMRHYTIQDVAPINYTSELPIPSNLTALPTEAHVRLKGATDLDYHYLGYDNILTPGDHTHATVFKNADEAQVALDAFLSTTDLPVVAHHLKSHNILYTVD